MNPLTPEQIRSAFINTSRREAAQATLPELPEDWSRLDLLGWNDAKRPKLSYVVLELDDTPTAILLRANDPRSRVRRAAMCAWCEDIVETGDVSMFVARRAGPAGRKGNSIGTMLCADFECSRNVRRRPTPSEVLSDDPVDRAVFIDRRIDGLRRRSTQFVRQVLSEPT